MIFRGISLRRSFLIAVLLLSVILGISGGVGLFTFDYAKGTSYLSNDPEACHNCHVMNTVFENWMKGGHQHVAVCNDCHVPHDFIGKWYTKGENGLHHSWAFTFKDIPMVIRARKLSKDVVQENCIRCHGSLFDNSVSHGQYSSCVSCHRQAGHLH